MVMSAASTESLRSWTIGPSPVKRPPLGQAQVSGKGGRRTDLLLRPGLGFLGILAGNSRQMENRAEVCVRIDTSRRPPKVPSSAPLEVAGCAVRCSRAEVDRESRLGAPTQFRG